MISFPGISLAVEPYTHAKTGATLLHAVNVLFNTIHTTHRCLSPVISIVKGSLVFESLCGLFLTWLTYNIPSMCLPIIPLDMNIVHSSVLVIRCFSMGKNSSIVEALLGSIPNIILFTTLISW